MAVDVSTLSIKVVSSGIDDSTAKLDKLSATADKAEVATKKFSTSSSSSYQAVTKELQNLQRVANTTSIVPASSGTAAAVAEIKMVTNAIAGVGTQSKKTAEESKNAFQAIGGSIAQLRTLLGGGLIMGGLIGMSSSIIEMADSWKMMEARLTQVTGSAIEARKAQNDLVDSSIRLKVPLEATVQLYTRAIPALKQYGYSAKDAMTITNGVASALKISGATGAEASSVMLQFSQSLNAGRLNGAEFNAVAEGAPIILKAMTDELKRTNGGLEVTRAQLKAMGAAGTLDINLMVNAIKAMGPAWEKAAQDMPLTFNAAMTNVKTAFTRAIGEMDGKAGVVGGLAKVLELVAKNADLITKVISVGLLAGLNYLIAKVAISAATWALETYAVVMNTKAKQANAVATGDAAIASAAGAAAQTAANGAMMAGAGAATTLSRVLSLMGGPIGIITGLLTLGAIAWFNWGDSAAKAADDAAKRIKNAKLGLIEFNKEQNQTDRDTIAAKINTLNDQIEAKKRDLAADTPAAKSEVNQLRMKQELINLNKELVHSQNLVKAANQMSSQDSITAIEKENEAREKRDRDAGQALLDKNDKQLQWENKKKALLAARGKAVIGMSPDSPEYARAAEQTQRQIADLEKLNPLKIEEARASAQSAKEARAQAAAQAKQAAATNQQTEAQSAYSNALQSIKEFQDGLNQAETAHKSLLIDINNKTRQAVDDINQKTAAIEAERKGTILTAAAKIAMDAQEKQAAAEAIDLKIREQEILRENSSMTLLEAKRNYDAQVSRIEQIGTATDAESKQARAAAVNQLQFYAGEVKKQTAIEQTIGKLTAEAEAQEKIKQALDAQAYAQAMLDMERIGRSLSQTLSEGFGEAAKSLGNLINVFEVFSKQQEKLDSDRAVAKDKAGKDSAKLAQAEQEYTRATRALNIKAYGDIAGASKAFLKEKTAGYKLLTGLEKTFRVYEMAEAAKSFAQKMMFTEAEIAAGTAKFTMEMMWDKAKKAAMVIWDMMQKASLATTLTGIGLVLTLAATIASFLGDKPDTTAQDRQAAAGTGSILGDAKAKSESISKAMDNLVSNSELSNEYNAGMLASLRNIEASMTGVASLAIKGGVNTTDFKGGIGSAASFTKSVLSVVGGLLNKPLTNLIGAVFGGKTSLQDLGITAKAASLGSVMSGGLNASKYTDIKKSGGWFKSDKVSRTLAPLSNEMNQQFGMVITGLYTSVMQAGKVLGMESGLGAKLKSFVVDIGNISLKDLSAEDIQKQFSTIFSKIGDDLAKFGFGEEFLAKYQKVGEGAFETLMRVASAIATVDGLFLNLGIDVSNAFDSVSMSGVDAKMQLIEFAGGLDKLSSSLGAYYDKYYTDAEKQKIVADQVGAKLASMGLNVMAGADEAATLANFRKLVEQQNLGTESGRRAYAALLEIAPTFADLADKLAAGELLGVGQTIPQAQMDAANAWWEAKGGPAAVDTQQVIANGITTLNDLGAKDKTIADMATQNAADTAATIQTLREMVAAQQTTNNILMAKIDSLTAAVADAGKKTVDAVVDSANVVTR